MLSIDPLAKLLSSYIKINWTDCNTASVLPHRSVTLGEEGMPGLTQAAHVSQHWWIWVPTNPASFRNYKGPAHRREIMWAQWSVRAQPPGFISLRGAWASCCYTPPGQ